MGNYCTLPVFFLLPAARPTLRGSCCRWRRRGACRCGPRSGQSPDTKFQKQEIYFFQKKTFLNLLTHVVRLDLRPVDEAPLRAVELDAVDVAEGVVGAAGDLANLENYLMVFFCETHTRYEILNKPVQLPKCTICCP